MLSSYRKTVEKRFILPVSVFVALNIFSPPSWGAYPIPVGTKATYESKDTDQHVLNNRDGTKDLIFPVWIGPEATGSIRDIIVPPGGYIKMDSKKTKGGGWELTGIVGDPVGQFSGLITSGTGTFEIQTEGIPGLSPYSVVTIDLNGPGPLTMGLSLPGDQLVGPDGSSTYITYSTSWCSYDKIGEIMESGAVLDVSLGCFDLNSKGRPTMFNYSFDQVSQLVEGTFAIQEDYIVNGFIINGTVTKEFKSQLPVPAPLPILGFAAMYRFSRKLRQKIKETSLS
jgi:hypothetical protein